MTGQLIPTPLPLLYRTAGIAPPPIRREVQARTQKHLQETDERHPMFGHEHPNRMLKSRKSFRTEDSLNPSISAISWLQAWNEYDDHPNEANNYPQEPTCKGKTGYPSTEPEPKWKNSRHSAQMEPHFNRWMPMRLSHQNHRPYFLRMSTRSSLHQPRPPGIQRGIPSLDHPLARLDMKMMTKTSVQIKPCKIKIRATNSNVKSVRTY